MKENENDNLKSEEGFNGGVTVEGGKTGVKQEEADEGGGK